MRIVAATVRRSAARHPSDIVNTEAFFADLKAQRRADRRRRRDVTERELVNHNKTWADDDDRWDDIWTETTSDGE
jgi:hypothetical protein